MGPILAKTDWHPLAYALMSSHIHWAARSGREPARRFLQPLHTSFALWLNRTDHTLGPVFAARFAAIACSEEQAALVIAYIHNNPVRAGVVADPADSSWTSHRAYLGLEPLPPWLDVEQGLSLCGYSASPSGRGSTTLSSACPAKAGACCWVAATWRCSGARPGSAWVALPNWMMAGWMRQAAYIN